MSLKDKIDEAICPIKHRLEDVERDLNRIKEEREIQSLTLGRDYCWLVNEIVKLTIKGREVFGNREDLFKEGYFFSGFSRKGFLSHEELWIKEKK